jgi:hypothetical protein
MPPPTKDHPLLSALLPLWAALALLAVGTLARAVERMLEN